MRTLVIALLFATSLARSLELPNEALTVDADDGEFDLRKSETRLSGNVHVTQGPMSIRSEEAVGSGESNENSKWTFSRSVHVKTREADMRSNTATAAIVNGQLTRATVKGSPATFEQRPIGDQQLIEGRAGEIDYDLSKGIVRMTNDVWFSYGGNEFRGDVVVYNVRDEKVLVNPTGESNGRVNIRIRPRNGTSTTPASPSSNSENGS